MKRIVMQGREVFYRDIFTDPDAPVIIAVHGIGLSSDIFSPLAEELKHFYRIISVDLPNFGASDKSSEYATIEDYASFLSDFIACIKISPQILIGNSFGCQIVLEYLARKNQQKNDCLGVTLIGPTVDKYQRSIGQQVLKFGQNIFAEAISRRYAKVLRDYYRANISASLRAIRSSVLYQTEDTIQRIGIPVLIIRGQNDPLVSAKWTETLRSDSREAQLEEVPDAAHLALLSHAHKTAKIIDLFLHKATRKE